MQTAAGIDSSSLTVLPAHDGLGFLRRQLSEPTPRTFRFQSTTPLQVTPDTKALTGVQLLRLGNYLHPQYGEFDVTPSTFAELIRHFEANVYGQRIFIDVAHEPDDGAAAEIRRLYADGEWLLCDIELTPFGIDAITTRKFIYLSADYADAWIDPATSQRYGAVLFGAGLTIRPFIKHQSGILLSERTQMNKFLQKLLANLKAKNAGESLTKTLSDAFSAELANETDEKKLAEAVTRYEAIADDAIAQIKKLTETHPNAAPVIQLSMGGATGLSLADVEKLLAEREQSRQLAEQTTAKKLSDNKTTFETALNAAQGLSDETRRTLSAAADLITADMTEDQVKRLAAHQIALGNQMEVNRQLSGMGFNVHGITRRITVDETNNIKKLSETVRQALQQTNAHASGMLQLSETASNIRFTNLVLAEYDRRFAAQLQREHRILSGAETNMGSAFLPASFQREVIREALSDLNILQLVRTQVDPSATTTTQIPYEERTSSATIPNEGIVYEGQGIPFAGVGLDHDIAYVQATKLALKVTNEIIHFSQSSGVNWNAWGENIASNARIMRELIHLRVANEMLRASDTYLSIAVTNESVTADSKGLIKTTKFPVVRPKQQMDLQGNTIGNPECPVTLIIANKAVNQWTGSQKAPAGTYWRFANSNLGYIQLVDKDGAVTGAGATGTLSYSTTGNIVKFDLKPASGVSYEKHLNGLIRMVGDQKSVLSSQRFVRPDFSLMSSMLNNEASKADQFVVSLKRDGTTNTPQGDLEAIKGLPAFDCNVPGIDIGDQRILIGQRGLTGYTIIKPYNVCMPFEAVDGEGNPTGEKVAYGEEYNALHTPKPVRNRYTSILVYDSATR